MSDAKTLVSKWGYPEAAAYLRLSPLTLRRKVMLKKIPHYKPFGHKGRVLFDPEDLEQFVKASRVEVKTLV